MLNLRVFRNPGFRIAVILSLCMAIGIKMATEITVTPQFIPLLWITGIHFAAKGKSFNTITTPVAIIKDVFFPTKATNKTNPKKSQLSKILLPLIFILLLRY